LTGRHLPLTFATSALVFVWAVSVGHSYRKQHISTTERLRLENPTKLRLMDGTADAARLVWLAAASNALVYPRLPAVCGSSSIHPAEGGDRWSGSG